MKKVLIISYYFPPNPEIGGWRIRGLAQYLPYFSWQPIILTKNLPNNSNLKYNIIRTSNFEYDSVNSFKKRIGFDTKKTIKKQVGKSDLKNKKTLLDILLDFAVEIIAYPDQHKIWYSHAFELGDKLLTSESIDAIISSSTPMISHIIAHDLKKKHDVPWIADLRDLWTQNHYNSYSCIRKSFEKKLEIETLATSDAITTVSNNLVLELKNLHKEKSVYSIPNGFDLDEFNDPKTYFANKFTITHTGSLYKGKRDPSKLFKALHELIEEQKIDREQIEVFFYGPPEDWMKQEIEKYDLKGIIFDCGLVSRDIALLKQKESQLLLILQWDHPSEIGVYTGKLFDYLAAKRPILAIGGQKGVINELLEETEVGFFVSSVEDVKDVITEYYNEYKLNNQVSYKGNILKIKKYSQKEMARKFAEILNAISK